MKTGIIYLYSICSCIFGKGMFIWERYLLILLACQDAAQNLFVKKIEFHFTFGFLFLKAVMCFYKWISIKIWQSNVVISASAVSVSNGGWWHSMIWYWCTDFQLMNNYMLIASKSQVECGSTVNTGLVFAILSMIVLLSSQSETCQLAVFLLIKQGWGWAEHF